MLLTLATVVTFPGPAKEARSPVSAARIFYRPHMGPDGGQAHPVFLDDGHGHVTRLATVTRSMGIGWSPDGRHVFLQDYWGSNVADCYVVTPRPGSVAGVSLLRLIQRTPGHPRGAERPFVSHYYVACDHWRSARVVLGAVAGHTDRNPSHGFDYTFSYDVARHRLRWTPWRKPGDGA